MKKFFLMIIFYGNISSGFGQVSIKITVDRVSNVKVTTSGNDPQSNSLIIDNKLGQNECTIIIKPTIPSTFIFGKGSQVPLSAGETSFRFNSNGQLQGYPDNQQKLTMPFHLVVNDKNDNHLLDTTIMATNSDVGNSKNKINPKNLQKSSTDTIPGNKVVNSANPARNDKDSLTKIPYFDAFTILEYKNIDRKTFEKILNYYAGEDVVLSGNILKTRFATNFFLKDIVDSAEAFYDSKQLVSLGGFGSFIGKGLSSVGGLDVTNIADGLAKFLVKRTMQELNIAFFEKFKTFISKYPDLQSVFPHTYVALTIIGDEIYNYEAYIQTLRESFEKDLKVLDENLPKIIQNHPVFFAENPALAATLQSGCYIAGALKDKVHPGDLLKNYPTKYLDSLNKNWKASIQTLQLFSASLRDTAANDDLGYWVNSKQVKALVSDVKTFQVYLGLVYETAKKNPYDSIKFGDKDHDVTLVSLLDKLSHPENFEKNYQGYVDFVVQFGEKANKLTAMIKNYSKPVNDSTAFEQYYNYFNSSIDLLEHCTTISNLAYIKEIVPDLADSLKDYFDVARSASDLVLDVKKRNYVSAIVNAVHIYDLVKSKHQATAQTVALKFKKKDIKDANEKMNSAMMKILDSVKTNNNIVITSHIIDSIRIAYQPKPQVKEMSAKKKSKINEETNKQVVEYLLKQAALNPGFSLDSAKLALIRETKKYVKQEINKISDDTLHKFYKYGAFMATMVQAKSSDDVEKVIEAFALPTGSARIKRESVFNVSLNAYTGLYGGYEHIKGIDNNCWQFNSYGVTAPIGVAISKGHSIFFFGTGENNWAKGKKGWSTSLFISLVDIGALASFRFKDDSTIIKSNSTTDTLSTSQVPTIQLKDIISPGVFLSIGIPKSPLSVNFGAQMGANLRKITSSNGTSQIDYNDKIYWRYSISVCVDIPLLNFYTKSK